MEPQRDPINPKKADDRGRKSDLQLQNQGGSQPGDDTGGRNVKGEQTGVPWNKLTNKKRAKKKN